jgi:hypothetical protein
MFGAEKVEIASADLVDALKAIEGRPWADGMGKNRDKPITQNMLARMLKRLRPPVTPQKVGPEDARVSGYVRSHLEEAFERYLGPEGVSQPDIRTEAHEIRTSEISQPDSSEDACPVADMQETQQRRDSVWMSSCDGGSEGGKANGSAPGLSPRTIADLAEDYSERAYANAQENDGDTRTAELDAWLRQRLADEMVLPEFVEVELKRVMAQVFRV